MRNEVLSNRLIDFAVEILRLTESLDNTYANNHISRQLVRSGTSVGANYEEARGAESKADFAHKMRIALKESRETVYWLKIIQRKEIIDSQILNSTVKEANEICAIFVSSIKTLNKKTEN